MLYNVDNPMNMAIGSLQGAQQSYAAMDKRKFAPPAPPKTAGGAMMNVAGGAVTGLEVASKLSMVSNPVGAIGGAIFGGLAYLLS